MEGTFSLHPRFRFGRRIEWKTVEVRAKRIIVVAFGPSLRGLTFSKLFKAAELGIHIIAVNSSIDYIPVSHSWFSLDPSPDVRFLMSHRRPGVVYYAAVPLDYGSPRAAVKRHRHPFEEGVNYLHRITGNDGPMSCKFGLAEEKDRINTGNSAYGAFGLAYHMEPEKIALLGVDGTKAPYASGFGAPKGSLAHLPMLFASTYVQLLSRNIRVVNGSPDSQVDCFLRMHPDQAVEWVMS